jgi:hypothetical protein
VTYQVSGTLTSLTANVGRCVNVIHRQKEAKISTESVTALEIVSVSFLIWKVYDTRENKKVLPTERPSRTSIIKNWLRLSFRLSIMSPFYRNQQLSAPIILQILHPLSFVRLV